MKDRTYSQRVKRFNVISENQVLTGASNVIENGEIFLKSLDEICEDGSEEMRLRISDILGHDFNGEKLMDEVKQLLGSEGAGIIEDILKDNKKFNKKRKVVRK